MKYSKIVGMGMAVIAISLIVSCKNGKNAVPSTDTKANTTASVDSMNVIPQVTVKSGFVVPKDNARFTFQHLKLNENILTMVVSYSGGCKEHEFDLISSGFYAKSMPPQLTLFLEHVNNDDACRELVIDTLRFDVSNVKYPGAKELILRFNNTKETLRYQYN